MEQLLPCTMENEIVDTGTVMIVGGSARCVSIGSY